MEKISMVISCYNDAAALMNVYKDISKTLKSLPASYEFIFIDNSSRDNTLPVLRKLADDDYNCNYLSLSRNVSRIEASFIGAKHSTGEYICFMDCYHPSSLIPAFFEALQTKQHYFIGGEAINDDQKKTGKRQLYYKMMDANIIKEILNTNDIGAFSDLFYNHNEIYWLQYKELEHLEYPWENNFIFFHKYTLNDYLILRIAIVICFVLLPLILVTVYDKSMLLPYLVILTVLVLLFFIIKKRKHRVFHGQTHIKESKFYTYDNK